MFPKGISLKVNVIVWLEFKLTGNDGGTRVVMITVTQVQILEKTVYISYSVNTLGKGMNPIILFSAVGNKKAARAL